MTDEGIELAAAMAWPRRGGFWRRFFASSIDYLVVLIPLYFLVAGLFLLTDGGVKADFWLFLHVCRSAKVHGGPSLERYDWQVCRSSLFGFPVADWAVGTAKETAQSVIREKVSFDLNSKEKFRPAALDLGFLQVPALAIYLLVMEASGRSIGKRAVTLVVYDENDWRRRGLPLQKAFRRQVIKFLGTFPLVLTGGWFAFQNWGSVPVPVPSYAWLDMVMAFVAIGLALIWPAWIAISIALGYEPIHDRIAGTTVRTRETHE